MAEQLIRAGMAGYPEVQVSSAGTVGLVGEGMDLRAAKLAERFGVADTAGHIARKVALEHIRDSDLVLAMSREHRGAVVEMLPRASRFTFTVREFARLSEAVTDLDLDDAGRLERSDVAGRLRIAVEAVALSRGTVTPPRDPDDDDVIDPYRRSDDVYDRSGEQLVPAANSALILFRRALDA